MIILSDMNLEKQRFISSSLKDATILKREGGFSLFKTIEINSL